MKEEKKQNEVVQEEVKVKDMFSIILDYKVNEDDSFNVSMSCKKDGKVSELKVLDERFLDMALDGLKAVIGVVSRMYVNALHDNGKLTDEEYNQIMNGKKGSTI